jgi:nitrogen fixation/metabolism regulation signal transduction histidine kinase
MPLELLQGGGSSRPRTRFASPERLRGDALQRDLDRAAASPVIDALLRSLGTAVFVLNEHRQILAANTSALGMLGLEEPATVLGIRPGEAVHCVHAHDEEAGCGTGQACATCGAVIAMLVAQKRGRPEERDCAITVETGNGKVDLELRVRAIPILVQGQQLVLVALSDVGQQNRHAAMERAFLHDIANVLTGLVVAADGLSRPDALEVAEATQDVQLIADRLVREVRLQRVLSSTLFEDYRPSPAPVAVGGLFADLARLFRRHPVTASRTFEVVDPGNRILQADQFLLARILTNLVKNAFEATPPGGTVRLSARTTATRSSSRSTTPGPSRRPSCPGSSSATSPPSRAPGAARARGR